MKILLVTSVFKLETVGPARFARLLIHNPGIDVDVLTDGVEEGDKLINVDLKIQWWQKKFKIYYSIPQYQKKILSIESRYDFILFNNAMFGQGYKGKLPYAVMVNDEKLIGLKPFFRFDYLRRLLHRSVEKDVCKKSDKIIVNSDYLKEKLIKEYKLESTKVHKLLKAISFDDKGADFPHKDLTKNYSIHILFVKNDYLIGGLLELIEGLRLLPHFMFKLTIVGPNIDALSNLKFSSNTTPILKGGIPNSEVVKLMYENDVLAIPARFEPLGVAVMEALAVGLPTVTTNQGGLSEITSNGKHVWLCKPNNPLSISKVLIECIENTNVRIRKSEKGKEYVKSKFGFDDLVDRLKRIIES